VPDFNAGVDVYGETRLPGSHRKAEILTDHPPVYHLLAEPALITLVVIADLFQDAAVNQQAARSRPSHLDQLVVLEVPRVLKVPSSARLSW